VRLFFSQTPRLPAENQQLMAQEGAIAMLVTLLDTPQELTQRQAAKALANLGVDAGNKIEIAKQGALPRLLNLIKNSSTRVKTEAVAAIANLAVDGELPVRAIVACVAACLVTSTACADRPK
jgi:hypothetical protein